MGTESTEGDNRWDPNFKPLDTIDLETQNLIAQLQAEEEDEARKQSGCVSPTEKSQGSKGSKRRMISLVDEEDDSDVEITPPTQVTQPRRQTSYGTASKKPMLQSTIDGAVGSSSQAGVKKKSSVPMKSVI